ncbi:MAG: hypothetical protein Q6373_006960 [Candidatus Sigynarchaeota archaeon]
MKIILHGCNDVARLQRGLGDPAIAGIEMDFYVEKGQVRVGHDPARATPIGGVSLQALGDLWRDTSKILVADIKSARAHALSLFSTDEGMCVLRALHSMLPAEVPIFVVGFAADWISLVQRTIKIWNGREITYFVAAPNLLHCQTTFRQPGIRFGLNPGHPTSLIKKFITESLPAMLEKDDRTATLGKGIEIASLPFKALESDAWNRADVKMAWTVDSNATLKEIQKLGPDYIIVSEYPLPS